MVYCTSYMSCKKVGFSCNYSSSSSRKGLINCNRCYGFWEGMSTMFIDFFGEVVGTAFCDCGAVWCRLFRTFNFGQANLQSLFCLSCSSVFQNLWRHVVYFCLVLVRPLPFACWHFSYFLLFLFTSYVLYSEFDITFQNMIFRK